MSVECKACLYRDAHPLGMLLSDEGICSGCSFHDEKNQLDWDARREQLLEMLRPYRSNSSYDCIVPVSGDPDSFYLLHLVVHELRLKPLVVSFNRTHNSAIGIKNLALLRNAFGINFVQETMNPRVTKKLIKVTMENLGTINWSWIAGQTSLPARTSVSMGIPLVIWGAHQGNEQVGMYSHLDNVEMSRRYRKEHDLLGIDEQGLMDFDCDFSKEDLAMIRYPSDAELLATGTRGLYLSNFFRWDPVSQHKFVSNTYGCLGKRHPRSYYRYDAPDCAVYFDLQDGLKQLRHGYGKVTDQLVRDIRHGRITKDRAVIINNRKLREDPWGTKSTMSFMAWLGADVSALNLIRYKFHDNGVNFADSLSGESNRLGNQAKDDRDFDLFGKGV